MMSIATYYRGRISFKELIEMPMDYIHTLRYLIDRHRNDENEKKLKEAEALEDNLEQI